MRLGASEAAESISELTYSLNLNSRDALWALTDIKTQRKSYLEALKLRSKLILKEKESSWVLLDQAETLIALKRKTESQKYLELARAKRDVNLVRLNNLQSQSDSLP